MCALLSLHTYSSFMHAPFCSSCFPGKTTTSAFHSPLYSFPFFINVSSPYTSPGTLEGNAFQVSATAFLPFSAVRRKSFGTQRPPKSCLNTTTTTTSILGSAPCLQQHHHFLAAESKVVFFRWLAGICPSTPHLQ